MTWEEYAAIVAKADMRGWLRCRCPDTWDPARKAHEEMMAVQRRECEPADEEIA